MCDYTICFDNKLNKVYLKKNSNQTNNSNIINSHIPYDSYDSNALSDLNTQLNNIYESNNYKKNNNNNELVEVDSSLFFEKLFVAHL